MSLLQVPLNQRRKLESTGAVLDSQESLGFTAGDRELLRLCTGDAAAKLKVECSEDAHAKGAMPNRMQPNWNVIEELVTEIQNLRRVLTWRVEGGLPNFRHCGKVVCKLCMQNANLDLPSRYPTEHHFCISFSTTGP